MMELAAKVPGYDGMYIVNRQGVVTSLKSCTKLKPQRKRKKNGKYYVYVNLSHAGKAKKHYVHRLVAEAFIPNPEDKPTVNHKDGDTENNACDNLEWSTMQEQVDHARQTGLTSQNGEACATSKLTAVEVQSIRELHASGKSQAELARVFDISTTQMHRIINGIAWKWMEDVSRRTEQRLTGRKGT